MSDRMMKNKAPSPEYFRCETSVWWDMDKCPIPDGYDAWRIGACIRSELKKLGFSGTITIFGLGNLREIPEHVLQALFSTGIALKHIPTRISNSTIVNTMFNWKMKHQAPVNVMLITDSQMFDIFYGTLCHLQDDKCNILLAFKESLVKDYKSLVITHTQWLWKSLLKDAKCSETGDFSCRLCRFDCDSFEVITKHLKSEAHEDEDAQLYCSNDVDVEFYPEDLDEKSPTTTTTMVKKKKPKAKRATTTTVKKPQGKLKKMKMKDERPTPQQEEEKEEEEEEEEEEKVYV